MHACNKCMHSCTHGYMLAYTHVSLTLHECMHAWLLTNMYVLQPVNRDVYMHAYIDGPIGAT